MPNMIEIIKKAAMDAVQASRPVSVVYGDVISDSPLEIQIDQKITLDADFLVLTRAVTDYEVEVSVDHYTESDADLDTSHSHPGVSSSSFDSAHKHRIKGKKTMTVHAGLKTGDKVVMIMAQGGQSYIVIDKVVNT